MLCHRKEGCGDTAALAGASRSTGTPQGEGPSSWDVLGVIAAQGEHGARRGMPGVEHTAATQHTASMEHAAGMHMPGISAHAATAGADTSSSSAWRWVITALAVYFLLSIAASVWTRVRGTQRNGLVDGRQSGRRRSWARWLLTMPDTVVVYLASLNALRVGQDPHRGAGSPRWPTPPDRRRAGGGPRRSYRHGRNHVRHAADDDDVTVRARTDAACPQQPLTALISSPGQDCPLHGPPPTPPPSRPLSAATDGSTAASSSCAEPRDARRSA